MKYLHFITFLFLSAIAFSVNAEQKNIPALHPLCQEASKMEFYVDYAQKKVFISFDTGNTPVPDSKILLECYIQGTKFRKQSKFVNGKATCVLPMPPPGRYSMAGMVRLDGQFFFDIFVNLEVAEKAPAAQFVPEKVKLTYTVDPDDNTITVTTDLKQTGVPAEMVHGAVTFNGKKGALKFRRGSTIASTTLALPKPHKPGIMPIVADLAMNGGKKIQVKSSMTIPSLEWMGNKIGMEDEVLPPWTPIRRKGNSLFCLNREYRFGAHGLPDQIIAKGKAILKSPITLKMSKNGKSLNWKAKGVKFEKVTDTKATIVGKIQAGSTEFEIRSEMEYDGFIYVTVKPLNNKPLPFDTLSLELPVNKNNALYRHLFSVFKVVLPKGVPAGNGVVETSEWRPFAWLGDNYRGLFWCCESDEMWPNKKGNAVEFVRSNDAVTLRLNVVKQGQKIKKNWNLSFMLMATPVKNYDARKARQVRTYGVGKNLEFIMMPLQSDGCGFYRAAHPERFSHEVAARQKRGIRVTPYTAPTFITERMPESIFFKKYWWFGFEDPAILRSGWPETWYCASPAAKGYADFVLWHAKKYIETHKLNGLYYDQFHPYAYAGKHAGTGYEENGIYYPTYPIRAQRNLFKRLYTVIKKQPWDTWIWAHMSAKMNIAALSWADGYFDGEHPFAALVQNKTYMEVMNLETVRAEFIGRQWGLAPFFLPEYRGKFVSEVEPTRELMAIGMVHDFAICRLWCNGHEMDRIRRELDLFDYGNSDFYAYFDDVPPAATDMKDIYISAYKHDNGSVLFVAANLSKEKLDRTGTIRINRNILNVKPGQYINWPDRTPLKADGDTITLTVPKMGYRMFVLGNPPNVKLPDPPFGQDWVLVNYKDRLPYYEKTMKLLNRHSGIEFTGYGKKHLFMHERSTDAVKGQTVVLTFTASGSGEFSTGFFLNRDYAYNMAGQVWQSVKLTDKVQQYQLRFPVKLDGVKSARHVISVGKDGKVAIYDCKVTVEKTVETPKAKPVVKRNEKTPFSEWTLANPKQRKEMAQYCKTNKNGVALTGKQYMIYFQIAPIPVKTGDIVTIRFKASGKGKPSAGFFSYTGKGYAGTKVNSKPVAVGKDIQDHEIQFTVSDPKIVQIRPLFIVPVGAEMNITDYQIDTRKPVAAVAPGLEIPFAKWLIADPKLRPEMAKFVTIGKNSVLLKGTKFFFYFQPDAIRVKTGDTVLIKFKASGKGQVKIGYFTYTNYGYQGVKSAGKYIKLTPEEKEYEVTVPVTDPEIKQIRPNFMILQGSEINVQDYHFELKNK